MRKLLLATTALIAVGLATSPASATLQVYFTDGTNTFSCADQQGGCDLSITANRLLTFDTQVGTFTVDGTLSISTANALTLSNFGVSNSGAQGTLSIFVSNTDYAGPISAINEAASINFLDNVGATASTLSFFADGGNGQGAPGTPGTPLFNVSGTPTTQTASFSGNNNTPINLAGPFSMTAELDLNLITNGSVTGANVGMAAVPGPIVGAGLPGLVAAGMMLFGYARNRRRSMTA